MPRKKLTEENIETLKPETGKQIIYADEVQRGLVLILNYGGLKTWAVRYYKPGIAGEKSKEERRGERISIPLLHILGRHPELTAKQARKRAMKFLANPVTALDAADEDSFKTVAEEFLKRHVRKKELRTADDIERLITNYIYPHWKERRFRDIKRGDVAKLLDHVEDNHGSRQADIVLAIIRKAMNWFAANNDDYVTPIVKGMGRYKPSANERERTLNNDEIRSLWTACEKHGSFGAFIKVLLLTGQRRDKVATMQWNDLVDGEWRIPTAKGEKANAKALRLPPLVQAILEAQPKVQGCPFVFPGKTGGHFNSFSQRKEELDKTLPDMEPWVLHDLRRTARSLMSEAGVLSDVAERVLGHKLGGVKRVYDRYDYAAEKADALQRLAAKVESIVNPPPENVVPIRRDQRRRRRRGA